MRKILAMLLALMMLCSFFTVTSFAEDAKIQATIIKVGENEQYKTVASAVEAARAIDGTVEDAVEVKTSDFVKYGTDFTLKEDSEVFTKVPDFKNIPFKEIGRYDYEVVNKWADNGTVVPAPAPVEEPIKVIVNDKPVEFDVVPTIINDRTMVPLRAIFEALGADVDWEAETKTVIVKDLPKEEVKDEEKGETEEEVKADDEKTADDETEEVTDEKTEEKTEENADEKAEEKVDETETKPEK